MDKKKVMIIAGSVVFVVVVIVIVLLMLNKKPNIYSVSFDADGGSLVELQMVNEGEQVKKPVDPTKEGYIFVEWTYQDKTYDFSIPVSSDFTLVARWSQEKEDVETFTVKFDSNGGTTISNQIVKKGNKVAKPIDPIKEGYTFKGWLLGNNMYDFSTIIEENIELKAEWEKVKENNNSSDNDTAKPTTPTSKKYTVTFNSNGGSSVGSQMVTEGGKVSKPSDPTRGGYKFAGWTLNGSAYNFDTKVTKDITLVAKWNQKTYTVKVAPVDQYSPDRILTVYEDGTQISVSAIKYNGVTLCSGSNMVVNMYEISGISSVTVVLTNGSSVTASVQ